MNSCDFFALGSYPFAEYYTFHTYSKEDLIKRINIFKDNNPQYKLIRMSSNKVTDASLGSDTESGYSLHFYFEDIDVTIHCIIKKGAGNPTRIGLTARSLGKNFANWKNINKELPETENINIKKKFETEILNKIGGWSRK